MKKHWLDRNEPQRKKSIKQEKRFAKDLHGRTTANSGAAFRQNDIKTKKFSFELKLTAKKQFTLKLETIKKALLRAENRTPAMILEFENDLSVVILEYSDFKNLIKNIENEKNC